MGATIAACVAIVPEMAVALTREQIEAVASQTTVVIAQGLQKGDIEARQEWNPGSGAIVARDGDTYYALTAYHVVQTRNVVYGIRTADGEVHIVDDVNNDDNIYPFGQRLIEADGQIRGFDLAIVKFQSDRDYPVAVMGDSARIRQGDPLYVSGWPQPEDFDARRVRKTAAGSLNAAFPSPWNDGGYSLLYDNDTQPGMSGGPVFNNDGELVGIHGRGRAQQGYFCIDPELSTDNSCGMQTLHFLARAQIEGLQLSYNRPPVDDDLLEADTDGDIIEDIYEAFTFDRAALLRDTPSGGCGSLLLGEECPPQ